MPLNHMELRCGDSSTSVPAESPRVPADCNDSEILWVSTDLKTSCPPDAGFVARDCQINGRCYRRLDPEYFAWLTFRMHAIKDAAAAGRVPADSFEELRQLFNALQARAIKAFGEKELLGALRNLDPEKYRPPLPEEFEKPKPAEPAFARASPESKRLARARVLVDQIRDQALAVGWSMDNLYFCDGYERRPIRPRYGLVCYVGAEQRIGEVTRLSIELIGPPPLEVRNRFYNPGVEQPWIQRTTFRCTENTAQASTQGLHFPRASRMLTVKAQFDSRAQDAPS